MQEAKGLEKKLNISNSYLIKLIVVFFVAEYLIIMNSYFILIVIQDCFNIKP